MANNSKTAPEKNALPKGWVWTKIGQICDLINGRAFKPSEWSIKGLPIIRIQNLNNPARSFNYCNFVVDEKFIVENGQLLFAWSGTPGTSFGAHIWRGGKAVLNQHIFRVEINDSFVNKRYFMHVLNNRVIEYIRKAHGTAGLAHITKNKFEESIVPLPPLPEQYRIVDKIEELFTKLDAGVEALNKVKAQLKRYRQAVLKHAFDGKLTAAWRQAERQNPDSPLNKEPASVPLERIKEERKKNARGKIKELPHLDTSDLPEGWEFVKLAEVSEINPKRNIEELSDDIDVTFVPMKCVHELTGHVDLSIERKLGQVKKGYTPFKNGDIIFAKITPCMENGKVAIVNNLRNSIGFGSTEFHVIRLSKLLPKKYFFYYLIREDFRKEARRNMTGSAGQLRVPVNYLKEVIVSIPHRIEQQKIVEEIERRFSVADRIEAEVEESLKQAERLRQSILRRAFEGKLVPQDSDDEPAEKLLERIEQEKQRRTQEHNRAGKAKGKKSRLASTPDLFG